jgi:hypothetical protein
MSFYFWLTSANIYLAALAVILDAPLVLGFMAVFCMMLAWRRSSSVAPKETSRERSF